MNKYRPTVPLLRETYETFLARGEGRHSGMGGCTNAYNVARDSGRIPSWCQRGTPSYAAAKAGLERRRLIREQVPA